MDSKEFFATLHYEENVFELVEDTKMEFLVYFRAPFTGAGEIVVPAGTKFVARGRMHYCPRKKLTIQYNSLYIKSL